MDIKGLDKVLKNLDKVDDKIEEKKEIALKKSSSFILDETIPITPMSPVGSATRGNLRKSGKAFTEYSNGDLVGKITFGDGRVDYAYRVHELSNSTNWSEPGTTNKYLEKTLRKNTENIKRLIVEELKL